LAAVIILGSISTISAYIAYIMIKGAREEIREKKLATAMAKA
jgi:hypothetical protein